MMGGAKISKVHACIMMMSFICSCRNKNQPKAIYPQGTFHHTRLFGGPGTNDMKSRMVPAAPGLLMCRQAEAALADSRRELVVHFQH